MVSDAVEANSAVLPGGKWAEETYEAMAPVYDDFTAHHNYELWFSHLLPALERHGLGDPGRLLDVGCCTGKRSEEHTSELQSQR